MAKAPDEDVTKKMKNMNINANTKKDINILLIGETGVGKSTFINSIFNYLQYGNFEKAESEAQLTVLIPSKFDERDKEGNVKTVTVGSENDKNEYLSVGESATQDVKTYIFKIRDTQTTIRLIDTPGMGDTNGGVEKDNAHCEKILSYISSLHHLHAICFLLKPTTTRLNTYFIYCMNQILSRLEKSASKNMVFVFTNTRGDNYSPGDTLGILQRLVKEIKEKPPYVDIPLNQNVFCLDNEAFRYLAGSKNGVEYGKNIRKKNKESWSRSTEECWKLISYVSNLQPHFVKHTSAINEARRMIFQLAQPIVDITENINDNLYVLEKHRAHLSMDYDDLADMKKHLYMPVVNLKVITLSQPVTVCKDPKCGKEYKVGGVNKWHYKKPCHDPCYLKQVPKEIIGSPELASCQSINPKTQMCIKCGHHFSTHMHIYYMSETVEEKQIDDNVLNSINTKALAVENAKKIIKNIENKKKELEMELEKIVHCNAQFAHFLQQNAIMPFSDSYTEYINHLIIREKSLGQASNPQIIKKLEDLVLQHAKVKDVFDKALQSSSVLGDTSNTVTPQKIQKSVEELYKLKNTGAKIKELYSSQKQSRIKEHTNTEYVHKTAFTKSAPPPDKKSEKGAKDSSADANNANKNKNQKESEGKKSAYVPPHLRNKSQQARARTPPPTYDSAVRDPPGKNPPHQAPPSDNRPPHPETYSSNYAFHPPPHSAYVPPPPPPPLDPRDPRPYPYDYHDRNRYPPRPEAVDSKPKSSDQPTSIQVNLTLPSRESNSASASVTLPADDPYYRGRDPHYPSPPTHHPDPHYPPPPAHHSDPHYRPHDSYSRPEYSHPPRDPSYPPSDPHLPRDPHYPPRDPHYPSRDPHYPPRDPHYPPRDPHYPSRDPHYPPRDPHYPPRDPNYPPRDPNYPPRDPNYPPRDPHYPPGDPHYTRDPYYSHRDPRDPPPKDPYYSYPPASSGGPPPPPHSPHTPPHAGPRQPPFETAQDKRKGGNRPQNYQQGGNFGGNYQKGGNTGGKNQGGNTGENTSEQGGNRGRGNANKGRGGITRKNFKKKNPNPNKQNDSDDSDTSVASSKK